MKIRRVVTIEEGCSWAIPWDREATFDCGLQALCLLYKILDNFPVEAFDKTTKQV